MPEISPDPLAVTKKFVGAWDGSQQSLHEQKFIKGTHPERSHRSFTAKKHPEFQKYYDTYFGYPDDWDLKRSVEWKPVHDFGSADTTLLNASVDMLSQLTDGMVWVTGAEGLLDDKTYIRVEPEIQDFSHRKLKVRYIHEGNPDENDTTGSIEIAGGQSSEGFHMTGLKAHVEGMSGRDAVLQISEFIQHITLNPQEFGNITNPQDQSLILRNALHYLESADPHATLRPEIFRQVLHNIPGFEKAFGDETALGEITRLLKPEVLSANKDPLDGKHTIQAVIGNGDPIVARIVFRNHYSMDDNSEQIIFERMTDDGKMSYTLRVDHGKIIGGSYTDKIGETEHGFSFSDVGEIESAAGRYSGMQDHLMDVLHLNSIMAERLTDVQTTTIESDQLPVEEKMTVEKYLKETLDQLRHAKELSGDIQKIYMDVCNAVVNQDAQNLQTIFDFVDGNMTFSRGSLIAAKFGGGGGIFPVDTSLEFSGAIHDEDKIDTVTFKRKFGKHMELLSINIQNGVIMGCDIGQMGEIHIARDGTISGAGAGEQIGHKVNIQDFIQNALNGMIRTPPGQSYDPKVYLNADQSGTPMEMRVETLV